jgi:monovalent cation:H+ antiporter-2, CPA2 family
MHETEFLRDVVIIFGMALVVAWAFRVLRAPTIIGFLATGMIIGPHAWGLVQEHAVDQFAEIGLVLLLFTIGLELSPAPLLRMGPRILIATCIQVGVIALLTALAVALIGGQTWSVAALVGVAVSLSSTAIVLKQLSDRAEVQSTLGNIVTGILLLQDVFVILIMAALPLLASAGDAEADGMLSGFLTVAGLAAGVFALRWAMPYILALIFRFGGRELSTLLAVTMAGGGAWVAGHIGWSPALGACIAGLLLANADVRHQLVAEITPFRDVFNALFFISLGMLVPTDLLLEHGALIGFLVLLTLAGKAFVTAAAVRVTGWPLRIALQAGIGLCTVSEFGFVLLLLANGFGFVPDRVLGLFMLYAVGTMLIGAMLFPVSTPIADWIARRFGRADTPAPEVPEEAAVEACDRHVIIVGYGVNGENLVHVLSAAHIQHCLVEMNPGLGRKAQESGIPVVIGDATRRSILDHAGLSRARALVVAVNDAQATRRVVALARSVRPDLYIIARTYFAHDFEALTRTGANVVVPADFEASVRIFSHVLEEFDVPRNILAAQIAAVRAGGYGVLRGKSSSSPEALDDLLKVLQLTATQTFFLPERSAACGQTIRGLNIRRLTGATVIAVVRDRVPNTNPGPEFTLNAGDVLVLVGAHQQLAAARELLEAGTQLTPAPPDILEAQK